MASYKTLVTLRYLRSRKGFSSLVTWFSMVGIALGVAALIVVMSVMAGFRADLLDKILGMTGHISVSAPQYSETAALAARDMLLQNESDVVVAATPYILGQGMIISARNSSGALIRGVQLSDIPTMVANNILTGELTSLDQGYNAIIGSDLAKRLGVGVGSEITLISPEGQRTVAGFIPRMMTLRIGAIFEVGMYQYDNGFLFTSLKTAQTFFRLKGQVSALDIYLTNPDLADATIAKVRKYTNNYTTITPWTRVNKEFFNALQVESVAMFIILTLIILVAAFNIVTSQITLVGDKKSDIAILRTFGATRLGILQIFFFNGLLIGAIGTAAGVALGIAVTANLHNIMLGLENLLGIDLFAAQIYYLKTLPTVLELQKVATIAAMSMSLTLLASLYPAWRASRLNPVEALRDA